MPQSFAALYAHVIYSTKDRLPLLEPEVRPELFRYCGGILRNRKCVLLAANGVLDHVHLLVSMSRESAIADLVRDVKASSSGWIHRHFPDLREFAWQAGYGAFTVSHSQIDVVKDYLARQEQHHSGVSFQEEFRTFLIKHEIEFDERYVWE